MSQLQLFDAQDWSTIISDILRQANMDSVTVDFAAVQEVSRTDPHALELLVYPDRIELRRITREEAAIARANDPSLLLVDRDNQSGKGKVVPLVPRT